MSTTDMPPTAEQPALGCPRCGAPLRPDQDWCLSCGAAVTTHVAGAPGWRTPVAIVGVVLLLAAAGLLVAFLELSGNADRVARAPTATPAASAIPTVSPAPTPTVAPAGATGPSGPTGPATTVPSVTPTPAPSPTPSVSATPGKTPIPLPSSTPTSTTGTIASWPAGRSAWTVVLKSTSSEADADAGAKQFQAQGKSIGVLNSSDYSSLRPGYWVVFSGQYDKKADAQSAADAMKATAPGAYARFVKP